MGRKSKKRRPRTATEKAISSPAPAVAQASLRPEGAPVRPLPPPPDSASSSAPPKGAPAGQPPLLAVWLAPAALAIILFANTLPNDFVFDDQWIVKGNPLIRDLRNTPDIFTTNYWQMTNRNRGLYRPLTIFTYALNYSLNGLRPTGYHVVNALLHAAVSAEVALLALALTRRRCPALAAGMLFAAHPIHVEAVANVVGRAELLATLGCLLFLRAHLAYARQSVPHRRHLLLAAGGAMLLLALLSKEIAITFLAAPVAFDIACAGVYWRGARRVARRTAAYAVYVAVVAAYLLIRARVVGVFAPPDIAFLDNPLTGMTLGQRLPACVVVLGEYARLLLWPARLAADYGYDVLPLHHAAGRAVFWLGVAAATVIGSAVAVAWRRPAWRTIGFAAVLFCAVYSLISNVVVVIGTPVAERLMYLPSVAAAWGLAAAWTVLPQAWRQARVKRMVIGAGAIAVIALGGRCVMRNRDWRTNLRLAKTGVAANPRSAKLHVNLAAALMAAGNAAAALPHLQQALDIFPTYSDAYLQMAAAHQILGQRKKRRAAIQRARKLSPRNVRARLEQGKLYMEDKDFNAARIEFEEALKLDPKLPTARFYAGYACLHAGDSAAALPYLLADNHLSPTLTVKRYALLGSAYQNLGQSQRAAKALRAGLEVAPDSAELLERLAYIQYAQLKNYPAARRLYNRLVKAHPRHPRRKSFNKVLQFLRRQSGTDLDSTRELKAPTQTSKSASHR